MKLRSTLVVLVLLFGVLSAPVFAQVTTASLTGTVVDGDGNPMDAATVVAVHEPSGTQYGVTTRSDGKYNLPNLRVGGPYTVSASYIGYTGQAQEGIYLNLAQKLNLSFTLESEATELETVVVTSNTNALIDGEQTGAATVVGRDQLAKLPTISRSASDYTRLTPSASGNSFAGRNDQFNNFSLDGSIFNNPFGLDAATPGGQTSAQPISLDAIDQIQVSLAPYDVTQAGFTGASVNAVTKSGTNEFKGTVFGFYRNQDFTGNQVSGTPAVPTELSQLQTGFSIGGPIIKDKLFFFANAEIERRTDAGSDYLASGNGRSGNNVSRVAINDLERVSEALFSRFGYETGPYEGFTNRTNNQKGIFKLDWNIGNGHSLTATYNFLDAFQEKPAHPSALGRRGPDLTTLQFQNSGYRINNIIHSGIVELRSLFGNKAANKLQVGYTAFRDSRNPFSEPFPVISIQEEGSRYIIAGHEPFSINNILNQDVFQFTDNFNIYAGDHTITIGTSFERFEFDNSFNLNAYGGTFGDFVSVDAFLDSLNTGVLDPLVDGARSTFENNGFFDWNWAYVNVGQLAFYLQDEWALSNEFTLTAGIRMDMPLYFNTADSIIPNEPITYFDEEGNPVVFDNRVLPKQTPLWSPRLGFNYDVKGDGTAQVRGGTGLFSGRLPFVWIGNHVANPFWFFFNVTEENFQFPQVWRSNLGYDQQLGDGWVLSTDLIYTKDINGMMVRNYGRSLPTGTLQGVDNRELYQFQDRAIYEGLGFPLDVNAYVFTNTDIGYSFNGSIQLRKYWGENAFVSLAYNYLDSRDASSIEAEISSDAYERNPALGHVNEAVLAPSLYGNRHRILGSGYKRFEYGNMATTVSVFFEYVEGNRFSYTYSGDINFDGSGLNDLIYIPTDGEIDQMQFSGEAEEQAAQAAAMKDYLAQDAYLSERRGEYAGKYEILSPWYNRWDLRVLQDYNFQTGDRSHTVQLSVDILNVGNLINSNWGVRQIPINTQPIGVSVDPDTYVPTYSFDTNLSQTFADDFSLLSRWQMQLGLRYIF